MGLAKLQEFIERRRKEAAETKIDWEKRKKEWLEAVNKLYELVENWLKEVGVEVTYEDTELFEERLGRYKVRKMVLNIGGEKVELRPVGTLVIAAKGRVDVEGPKGRIKIVLVPKDSEGPVVRVGKAPSGEEIAEWEWKIATPPPDIRYIELNKDTFSEILLGVLGADY